MMTPDIVLYDSYEDLMDWYDEVDPPAARHMRLLSIHHPERIEEHLQTSKPALFTTYDMTNGVRTRESDARTHALSLLHNAGAVEHTPAGG